MFTLQVEIDPNSTPREWRPVASFPALSDAWPHIRDVRHSAATGRHEFRVLDSQGEDRTQELYR